MVFTTNDAAHLFFGLPVMLYGHIVALDAYNGFGRGRKMPKWAEGVFLIIFGSIIFVGDIFGYRGCFATGHPGHMCIDINIMHMLFGIFMMAIGVLSLMHTYMNTFDKASMWMTPVCLVVVGVFMMSHQQEDAYGIFVHTSFGVSAQAAAILRGLTIVDPKRWAIFTAYASSVTAMCFISGSDSMDQLMDKEWRLMGHTVVLGVCTVSAVLLIPFMLFIAWMNKGIPQQHEKFVEHDKFEFENEMPLIGGKY